MIESTPALVASLDGYTPSDGEVRVLVLIGATTILYLAYHLGIRRSFVARLLPGPPDEDALRTRVSFFRKGLGTVLLGVVPAIGIAAAWPGGLSRCGLTLDEAPRSLALAALFIALSALPILSQAKKPSYRLHYPEVRMPFTPRIATWNALAWIAFLIAYELFFRGILVLGLAAELGPLPALAISLMAYVFVHLDRYVGETLGTLVSGTVFSLVALDTGSLLMPIVAHLGVALLSDHLAARPLPERSHG